MKAVGRSEGIPNLTCLSGFPSVLASPSRDFLDIYPEGLKHTSLI